MPPSPCLFVHSSKRVIEVRYVDDSEIACKNKEDIEYAKNVLKKVHEIIERDGSWFLASTSMPNA